MQDREKWSCQILKEACWAHRDGRPVVRRTFLAGLEACLFTKVDVLLQAEERGEYWERKRKMYQQLCNIHKIWKGSEAAMYSIVSQSWIFNLTWAESCSKLDLPYSYQRFFKGFSGWTLQDFVHQTHNEQKCSFTFKWPFTLLIHFYFHGSFQQCTRRK